MSIIGWTLLTRKINERRVKRHLDEVRISKPSLAKYYAAYIFNKPLKDVSPVELERAKRALIPIVLKYYLNNSLNWETRSKLLINEMEGFYTHFCRRKKMWSFSDPEKPWDREREEIELRRLVSNDHDVWDVLRWCRSPVPKSRYAFISLLHNTRVEDVEKGLKLGYFSMDQLVNAYRSRKSRMVPAVKDAILNVLGDLEFSKEVRGSSRRVYRPNKRGRGRSVFYAYLESRGLDLYLCLEREFKLELVRVWFTSKNRKERERRLEKVFPGLFERVGYTTVWDYIRGNVDEFVLSEALSRDELEEYFMANGCRLGRVMRERFLKAR